MSTPPVHVRKNITRRSRTDDAGPSFPSPKTRASKRLAQKALLQQSSIVTVQDLETSSYSTSDNSTDTCLDPVHPEPAIPEISDVCVNFSTLQLAVFGRMSQCPGLNDAARRVARSGRLAEYLKTYFDLHEAIQKGSLDVHDPDLQLMEMFNLILRESRQVGLRTPYVHDVHYAKRYCQDENGKLCASYPFLCAGIDFDTKPEFGDTVLLIDTNSSYPSSGYDFASEQCLPISHDDCDIMLPPRPSMPDDPNDTLRTSMDGSTPSEQSPQQGTHTTRPTTLLQSTAPLECFERNVEYLFACVGNRSHVLALEVRCSNLRLYYFDRAGSIRSTNLDLKKDLTSVVALILRISLTGKNRLGYEPFFRTPQGSVRRSWSTLSGHEVEVEGETYRATRFIYTEDTLYGQGKLIYAARPTLGASRSDALVKCSLHLVS